VAGRTTPAETPLSGKLRENVINTSKNFSVVDEWKRIQDGFRTLLNKQDEWESTRILVGTLFCVDGNLPVRWWRRQMDLSAKGIILPVIHLSIHLLIHAYRRVEERKKEERKGKNPECLVAIEMRKDQGETLKGPRSISSIGSALTETRRPDIPKEISNLLEILGRRKDEHVTISGRKWKSQNRKDHGSADCRTLLRAVSS